MRTNSQHALPMNLPLDFVAGMEQHGITLKDLLMAEVVDLKPVPKYMMYQPTHLAIHVQELPLESVEIKASAVTTWLDHLTSRRGSKEVQHG